MDKDEALKVFHAEETGPETEARFKQAVDILKTSDMAHVLLMYPEHIQDKPYANEVLRTAALTAAKGEFPHAALVFHQAIDGRPFEAEVREAAFRNAALQPISAQVVLQYGGELKGTDYEDVVLQQAFLTLAKSELSENVFGYQRLIKGKLYEDEVLHQTMLHLTQQKDPYFVLQHKDAFVGKPFENEIVQRTFENAAKNGVTHFIINHYEMIADKPYAKAVTAQIGNTQQSALSIGYHFNSLHEEPDATRFALLQHLSPQQKFNVITLGRAEIYTSTYRGVVNSLLSDLQQSHAKLTDILSPEQLQHIDIFLEAAASYNRMGDVLKAIPKEKMPDIVHQLGKQAAGADTLAYTDTLVTMMTSLKGDVAVRPLLEAEIKTRYEAAKTAGDQKTQDRFGLISSAYDKNGTSLSPAFKPFFDQIAHDTRYALPPTSTLPHAALVDKHGVCNQLMVFAEDEDSVKSFAHFKQTYAGQPGWKIEDKGSYIEVEHSGAGTPVRIFANKPDQHDAGLAAINKAVAQSQGQSIPQFQVFVGRGHSFHAEEYLPLITKDMHLVHLGSCGGFQNLGTVLQQSPHAQVISTQQTGSMYVNDPLLLSINKEIVAHGSVNWQVQQQKLNSLPSENKEAYLLPNRNIAAMVEKKYNSLQAKPDAHELGINPQGRVAPKPAPIGLEKLDLEKLPLPQNLIVANIGLPESHSAAPSMTHAQTAQPAVRTV